MKNQELYSRAKRLIPGGTQLLSKRPEMFLPDQWPSYFSKASGIEIWDLEGRRFIDMSIMGIGTCALGYANKFVDGAVKNAISNGSMSTLNSWEEVHLAEKLVELHPGMDMVRFTRTGGEANAVATRIARAASGKGLVAVCGYHGWHDWYLATNLTGSDNLEGLLLPGLNPVGLPQELTGTTLPFQYGDQEALSQIVAEFGDKLGAICVEVQRGRDPDINFLHRVQEVGKSIGAVVIFDEISSGFRMSIGGIYKNYDLNPDMVVLGKSLGNGFAISAILGKRAVMEAAQKSFISSSYWTERTGFAAALATIQQFEESNIIDYLIEIGQLFDNKVSASFREAALAVEVQGLVTVPILKINEDNPLVVKTYFTQEMLALGYLASTVIYLSAAHTDRVIENYADAVFNVANQIKALQQENKLAGALDGPVCHSGFQRLT
jgi:glutamate-1-semialdehyde 2,1-aminomutase